MAFDQTKIGRMMAAAQNGITDPWDCPHLIEDEDDLVEFERLIADVKAGHIYDVGNDFL